MTQEEKIALNSLQKLYRKKDKISQEIDQAKKLLSQICSHSERKDKEEYIEGSYYNTSEYRTYSVCSICGDKQLKRLEIGSYV